MSARPAMIVRASPRMMRSTSTHSFSNVGDELDRPVFGQVVQSSFAIAAMRSRFVLSRMMRLC